MSIRSSALCALFLGLAACADLPAIPVEPSAAEAALGAAGIDALTDQSQAAKAIFIGEIIAIEDRLSEPDANGRVVPFHFVTWQVESATHGVEAGQTWTGRFAGGALPDGRTLWVSEVPEFQVGQRALVLANDGDAGACALIGCREGLLPIGETGLDEAAATELLGWLDDGRDTVARSADPARPFTFTTHPRSSVAGLHAAANRANNRLERPTRATAGDPAELLALERNGGDPVLPQ